MFGTDAQGYEQHTAVHEAEGRGSVELRSITPDQALVEWLSGHGFNRLVSRMAKSGLLEVVATATPGIKDLLVLGRIKALEQEGVADLIIVDAPAAGHALGFLRSPAGVRDTARTGTIHRQAVEALEMISDPSRCQVILATIPEETPINELIETSYAIEDEAGVKLGPVVVNGILPDIADLAVPEAHDPTSELHDLQTAAAFRLGRQQLQASQLERLAAELPLAQLRMPQLFGTQITPHELDTLATTLLAEIDRLPEPR